MLDGSVRLDKNRPKPTPSQGEAVIKPLLAGICDTDLQIVKGYMAYKGVLGHEFVGVVESAPDKSLVGKRVVGEINCECGVCKVCRDGRKKHCPNRTVLGIMGRDGGFADYLTLPVEKLHVVPDSIPDNSAVFTEPLAAAFQVLRQVSIKRSDRVAVIGDGKLGLLVAQVARLVEECDLLAIGHHPDRLAILERKGINTSLEKKIEELEYEFDYVIDATGASSGFRRALKLVKPGGAIILKTTIANRGEFDLNKVVIDEITIIGSRCGPFEEALGALEIGLVDTESLITEVMSLNDGEAAIKKAAENDTIKILLSMD